MIVEHAATLVLTLPRVAGTHADISDVAGFDNVMEGLHRLFDGRVVVKTMACMRWVQQWPRKEVQGNSH